MDKGVPFGPGSRPFGIEPRAASRRSPLRSLTLIFRLHNAEFHSI